MTPKDVWSGSLRIGDSVRHLETGEIAVVEDLVQVSLDGTIAVLLPGKRVWPLDAVEKA